MFASSTARVGIVDHQPLALLGARAAIDAHPELDVRAFTSDRDEALELLTREDLDLLLVDADHPQIELEELLHRERSMRILLTSERRRPPRIELRDSHLVLGFVSKWVASERFSALVFEAAAGARPGSAFTPGPPTGGTDLEGGPTAPRTWTAPGGDGAPPAV